MHSLICGTTECGKSTLAEVLVDRWVSRKWARGPVVIVSRYVMCHNKKVTNLSLGDAIIWAQRNINALIVIDDAGGQLDRHDPGHIWLGTESRHYGHNVVFVVQRPTMLAPTIRHQCEMLYMFLLAENDRKTLAIDFCHEDILRMQPPKKYEFDIVRRFNPVFRWKLVQDVQDDKWREVPVFAGDYVKPDAPPETLTRYQKLK